MSSIMLAASIRHDLCSAFVKDRKSAQSSFLFEIWNEPNYETWMKPFGHLIEIGDVSKTTLVQDRFCPNSVFIQDEIFAQLCLHLKWEIGLRVFAFESTDAPSNAVIRDRYCLDIACIRSWKFVRSYTYRTVVWGLNWLSLIQGSFLLYCIWKWHHCG